MSVDQLTVMPGSKCIVQVRGVRPFLSDKYDLKSHPNYRLTADYSRKNRLDVAEYISKQKQGMPLKADDKYVVIKADKA